MQINKNKPKYVTLSTQPILKLNYSNNRPTTKVKQIQLKIYKAVENEFGLSLQYNKTLQVKESFENLYLEYKNNNSLYTDSVVKTLKNIWGSLTSGGKLIKEIQRKTLNLDVKYTTPIETADNRFVFTDLAIKFKEYGNYQFIFIVDGIETPLSPIVTVSQGLDEDYVNKIDVN